MYLFGQAHCSPHIESVLVNVVILLLSSQMSWAEDRYTKGRDSASTLNVYTFIPSSDGRTETLELSGKKVDQRFLICDTWNQLSWNAKLLFKVLWSIFELMRYVSNKKYTQWNAQEWCWEPLSYAEHYFLTRSPWKPQTVSPGKLLTGIVKPTSCLWTFIYCVSLHS
jgi:hypothetical protein